jgi:hypothetical protein
MSQIEPVKVQLNREKEHTMSRIESYQDSKASFGVMSRQERNYERLQKCERVKKKI